MYAQGLITTAILVGLAQSAAIEQRQTSITSKEFTQGGCRPILFAWARGSTETGNMGTVVGPDTSNELKRTFGSSNVATEGIDYAADLAPNFLPGGTDTASKQLMQNMINSMASRCPDSIIVTGGYSQGAAVNHRAIEGLSSSVKDRIAGVILYGDTQRLQDNGRIPNFPADKVKIICNIGDLVCYGSLTITAAHLTYGADADEGAAFLAGRIRAAQSKMKARNAIEDAAEGSIKMVAKALTV